jgi:hypothetical protein
MKRCFGLVTLVALTTLFSGVALGSPGLQVTTCTDLGDGVWHYTFFACTPNIDANDLHVRLLDSEVLQGEAIVGCSVPALAGFGCSFTPTEASYSFPTVGPFACVPDLPGDVNKFGIDVLTPDGVSLVQEIWTLDGAVVAAFTTVIACPPVSVEDVTWGRVKALYR